MTVEGGQDGRLRRPIGVEERPSGAPPIGQVLGAGFAGDDHMGQGRVVIGRQGRQRRRGQREVGDLGVPDQPPKRRTGGAGPFGRQHQARARSQGHGHLADADVETEGAGVGHAAGLADAERLGRRSGEICQGPVLHHHALGLPRGSGGVDHIGHVGASRIREGFRPIACKGRAFGGIDDPDRVVFDDFGEVRARHGEAGARVVDHEPLALGRQGRIHRQEHAAGHQDAKEGCRPPGRAA